VSRSLCRIPLLHEFRDTLALSDNLFSQLGLAPAGSEHET
jgi:hypothetical protein